MRTAPPEAAFAETAQFVEHPRAEMAWAHPDAGLRAAASGVAERREGTSIRAALSGLWAPPGLPDHMPGPWFGGVAFDGATAWPGFSPLSFTLPALLSWSSGARHFVAAFGDGAQQRVDEARRLDAARRGPGALDGGARLSRAELASEPSSGPSRVLSVRSDRRHWDALVARALASIASGALDKVVLARAISVACGSPIDADALLARLSARYPACRAFLIRGANGEAFLGATPELLCTVEGSSVRTEALAGSAHPSEAAALLGSRKDLREHRWVVDHIVRALNTVASSVERKPEPGLRTLPNVVHLHTPISARLFAGRSAADVAAALHPTPAVAGVPATAALRFIRDHEQLDRGLYAGLVGWAGPHRAELAVALRSALVRGATARVFAGAGIVDGSSAAQEWRETELKARPLLDALGATP